MELGLDLEAWWLTLVAAPFIGSFLGVLIVRLPAGEPVGLSRSRCVLQPRAERPRSGAIAELGGVAPPMPLLRQPARLLLPEHRAGSAAGRRLGGHRDLWAGCSGSPAVSAGLLLALAVIDAKHLYLPDVITLPLIPAGLAVVWLVASRSAGHPRVFRYPRLQRLLAGRLRLPAAARSRRPRPRRREAPGGGGRLAVMAGSAGRGHDRRRLGSAGVSADGGLEKEPVDDPAHALRTLSMPWYLARLAVRAAPARLSPSPRARASR